MPGQTLAALRELTEAVMAEFFGNDTNLSKRLIKATNDAQLLLMVQPPDDGRVNRPAPAKPVVLVEPVEAPTSDETERLLETARAAQVAGTFPSDSAIRLLTDDYGWNESERRHCMAAARLALAYWGHAWGCLTTNNPFPVEPADMAVEQLQHIIHREPWATWLRSGGCLESAHCELTDLLSSVIATDRARRATPPAEGEVGGLVSDLEVAAASYFNRGFVTDARRCRRAADLLQQQAAELAMLRGERPHG